MHARSLVPALLLSLVAGAASAAIELVPGTVNMFRDTRGANDVGIGQGDRFQFGADVAGGSLGTTLGATYLPSGFTVGQATCAPLAVNPGFCAGATPFASGRLGAWSLRFERGGESLVVDAPSLTGTENPVPFPVSVTLSGSGIQPTVSWLIGNGFVPDGLRVNIFDKSKPLPTGIFDVTHSVAIDPGASAYTLPSGVLSMGGQYAINLQVIETRGHVAFTNNNAQILRRSSSFFNFTPLAGEDPPAVALPTVVDGVYHFNVAEVGPDAITFIDPLVAVGYDYAVGAGDPNFASVLLPDVGDGQYTLSYALGGASFEIALADGLQYFFPQGGVSAFSVRGIETAAGLDPADVTAFITGVSFAGAGSFTGTMTPVTVFVPSAIPEPDTIALVLAGLGAVALRARRSGSRRGTPAHT